PRLRSAFSFAFDSLTVTFLVTPWLIENAVLPPPSLSVPVHASPVAAGQLTLTGILPFFDALTLCFGILSPANGRWANTEAVAVALRPVESVTVTVPKWICWVEKERRTEPPDAPSP